MALDLPVAQQGIVVAFLFAIGSVGFQQLNEWE